MGRNAVVIGAGFGGLSAAALLARDGWNVSIVERNDSAGGRARWWKKDGFVFDMGPSWYLMPEVFERFFSSFGVSRERYYGLSRLDPGYRVSFAPGEAVDVPADAEATCELFERFEPGGGKALRAYLDQARYRYDIAMREFLYREYRSPLDFFNARMMIEGTRMQVMSSLDRAVRKLFRDRRSRQILEYAMVFLGTAPSAAPALYSLMSHVDLNLGVWYPDGGLAGAADGIRRLAADQGATLHLSTEATEIVVRGGRAVGVGTSGGEIPADLVVVGADYHHAETVLLPEEYRSYSEGYWRKRVVAPSMFILYLGVGRTLPSLRHHNLYFSDPWEEHFDTIFGRPRWPEEPCFYLSCISKTDPASAPAGKENLFVLVPTAAGLDDDDAQRHSYAERLLRHVERITGESITDSIELMRIYSQRDFSGDYHAYRGTALGLAHTLLQTAAFRPSHRSRKVRGLWYTGQYTHPGVGVPMTLISSEVVCREIAKERK